MTFVWALVLCIEISRVNFKRRQLQLINIFYLFITENQRSYVINKDFFLKGWYVFRKYGKPTWVFWLWITWSTNIWKYTFMFLQCSCKLKWSFMVIIHNKLIKKFIGQNSNIFWTENLKEWINSIRLVSYRLGESDLIAKTKRHCQSKVKFSVFQVLYCWNFVRAKTTGKHSSSILE